MTSRKKVPRFYDYDAIYALKDRGLTGGQVAMRLKIPRGAVYYALMVRGRK